MSIHIRLTVLNRHGVLDQISGLIRRNGWNISEINAGEMNGGVSCINIRMRDKGADILALRKALSQLSCVQDLQECSPATHFVRELLLFSMNVSDYQERMVDQANQIGQDDDTLFFSFLASPTEIDALLDTHGGRICDYSRGGPLGLRRKDQKDG
jgi:acetolactate synthase small subunit